MSIEEASAFEVILRERFPREEGETPEQWRERAYGIAHAARVLPRDLRSSESGHSVPVDADIADLARSS
ncbi:MAG: hypothetical protein ACRDH0_09750 [Actinomycetota bacterium]